MKELFPSANDQRRSHIRAEVAVLRAALGAKQVRYVAGVGQLVLRLDRDLTAVDRKKLEHHIRAANPIADAISHTVDAIEVAYTAEVNGD